MKRTSKYFALMLLIAGTASGDCVVSVYSTYFNLYQAFDPAPSDTTGGVVITCPAGIPYNIKLDAGNSPTGYFPRQMRSINGTSSLHYNLYADYSRTMIWGDGISNTFIQSDIGTGATQVLTIYGRIPPFQNVEPGSYTDSIGVLVEY